jgi:Smg protein
MFEVLGFCLRELLGGGFSCPELPALHRKLNALGFCQPGRSKPRLAVAGGTQKLHPSLAWTASHAVPSTDLPQHLLWRQVKPAAGHTPCACSPPPSRTRLGTPGLGIAELSWCSIGALAPGSTGTGDGPRPGHSGSSRSSVDDLKLVVLMVFWSLGEEPDALVLDELCDSCADRLPC